MVKSELIQKLCNNYPTMLRKDVEKIVEIIISEMVEALCRDEAVEISAHLLHPRLLQHDLGDPYMVGIGAVAPVHLPLVRAIPGE